MCVKFSAALPLQSRAIGALRTHAGDAHGRERGFRRIDVRIARLATFSQYRRALPVGDVAAETSDESPQSALRRGTTEGNLNPAETAPVVQLPA